MHSRSNHEFFAQKRDVKQFHLLICEEKASSNRMIFLERISRIVDTVEAGPAGAKYLPTVYILFVWRGPYLAIFNIANFPCILRKQILLLSHWQHGPSIFDSNLISLLINIFLQNYSISSGVTVVLQNKSHVSVYKSICLFLKKQQTKSMHVQFSLIYTFFEYTMKHLHVAVHVLLLTFSTLNIV